MGILIIFNVTLLNPSLAKVLRQGQATLVIKLSPKVVTNSPKTIKVDATGLVRFTLP